MQQATKPLELNFRLTLDENSVRAIVQLFGLRSQGDIDSIASREARLRSSQNALFAGQKPPEDRGLLMDMNEVAKLLKVCARTVWKMEHDGEMPKAIRIGKAVRWGAEELADWVAAGCPRADEWKRMWEPHKRS